MLVLTGYTAEMNPYRLNELYAVPVASVRQVMSSFIPRSDVEAAKLSTLPSSDEVAWQLLLRTYLLEALLKTNTFAGYWRETLRDLTEQPYFVPISCGSC